MQPGDVPITYADTKQMEDDMNFKPSTSLREGLKNSLNGIKIIICNRGE